jgi:hypothetical protein
MGPLGWLNQSLMSVLPIDLELLATLFGLDPYRMHVLGLGIAHCRPEDLSPDLVKSLAHGPAKIIVKQLLGRRPQGLDRALHALGDGAVLEPEAYRALVELLHDRATAAHLHHRRAVSEPLIVALAALPRPLRRPAIFKLLDDIDGMDRFVAGLHILCDRTGVPFDRLVDQLGALDQTEQVKAKIVDLADRLPLPDRLPDRQLGSFQRVDDGPEIRSLAKSWRNCIGQYLHEVNEGAAVIYRSIDDGQPAAAVVGRAYRLGWALVDMKGPNNIDLDPHTASRHYETFASAGIPRLADVAAIRSLMWCRRFPGR